MPNLCIDDVELILPMMTFWLIVNAGLAAIYRRANSKKLDWWAEEHGYLFTTKRTRRFLERTPFWIHTPTQSIYRVTVRDEVGNLRDGWIKINSAWEPSFFVETCPLEVIWEASGPSPKSKLDKAVFQEL